MIIERQESTSLITQEKESITKLVQQINMEYKRLKNDNLVIQVTALNKLQLDDLLEFLQLSNKHRRAKHSFVIVNNSIELEDVPDEIIVVPTLQEAYDIIEMEDIERDLGF